MSIHDETWDRPTCTFCGKTVLYGMKGEHGRDICVNSSKPTHSKQLMKTYTETEVKEIYAQLIEQIGHDAGAVCNWSGVDSVSLETWKKAWWQALQEYGQYEQSCGAYNERKRIAEELLKLNV